MHKRVHHATARDLDRALGFAIRLGNDASLIRFVREHSWGLARMRNEDARPVHIPQSALARQWGVDRSRLAKDLAQLVEDRVLKKIGNTYLINKDVWSWSESRVSHAQKLLCIHGEDVATTSQKKVRRDHGHRGAGAPLPAARRRVRRGAGATVVADGRGATATTDAEVVAPAPQPAPAPNRNAQNLDSVETSLDFRTDEAPAVEVVFSVTSEVDARIKRLIGRAHAHVHFLDDDETFVHLLDAAIVRWLRAKATDGQILNAYQVAAKERKAGRYFVSYANGVVLKTLEKERCRDEAFAALPSPPSAGGPSESYFSRNDDPYTDD